MDKLTVRLFKTAFRRSIRVFGTERAAFSDMKRRKMLKQNFTDIMPIINKHSKIISYDLCKLILACFIVISIGTYFLTSSLQSISETTFEALSASFITIMVIALCVGSIRIQKKFFQSSSVISFHTQVMPLLISNHIKDCSIKWMYGQRLFKEDYLTRFNLVPRMTTLFYEDSFSGTYKNTDFEIEAIKYRNPMTNIDLSHAVVIKLKTKNEFTGSSLLCINCTCTNGSFNMNTSHLTQYDTDLLTVYSDCEEDIINLKSNHIFKHLLDLYQKQNLYLSKMRCSFYKDEIILVFYTDQNPFLLDYSRDLEKGTINPDLYVNVLKNIYFLYTFSDTLSSSINQEESYDYFNVVG